VGGRGDDCMRDGGGGMAEVTVSDVSDAGEVGKLFVFNCSSMETTLYVSFTRRNKKIRELHSGLKDVVNVLNNRYSFQTCIQLTTIFNINKTFFFF